MRMLAKSRVARLFPPRGRLTIKFVYIAKMSERIAERNNMVVKRTVGINRLHLQQNMADVNKSWIEILKEIWWADCNIVLSIIVLIMYHECLVTNVMCYIT